MGVLFHQPTSTKRPAAADKVRSSFQSRSVSPLTRLEHKMTIACDIPTQMIVDDSSSSPETSNLAEVMKRRRKKKKRSPMVGNTFSDLYKLTGQSLVREAMARLRPV